MPQPAFDFGENWKRFSENALDDAHFRQAQDHFNELMSGLPLAGSTFLDIGFGQGLSLLAAASSGAKVHGLDINPKCVEVLRENARRLGQPSVPAQIAVGSILDPRALATVRAWSPDGFDIVHSWGVLHHTGDMWEAIEHACDLVRPRGHLVLAIYNRHWSSSSWRVVKRLYVASPAPVRKALTGAFVPIIYLAKLLVTGRNPLRQKRGMDFHYDVIDWIGGYPYEYASRDEIEQFVSSRGFVPRRFTGATVPTGCNQYVFAKR
jgi:2-polyprenyl-3-methyl-5-hydroxy-6-metoxy-1,4-benzoquinol methylase